MLTIILRRWQRWVRMAILLLCLFVTWNIVRDLFAPENRVYNSWVDGRRIFDHWGKDDTDINWMPSLLAQRTQEIPVVVVEEHYEVLKYWFQAADLGVIPMSKNILVHIDGHVDGAVPFETEILPVFRYPRTRQEVHSMMQRNDMFIVVAALAGLVDHVIWVWPDWDSANHDGEDQNHVIIEVEIGYMKIKIEEEIGRHKMDLCACWRFRKIGSVENNDGEVSWECHRRNFSEIEAENGPEIQPLDCQIHSQGTIEIMSETAAADALRKIKLQKHYLGFILDIDEDFYGCWSDMIAMQAAGIKKDDISFVSDLVADLLFGLTAHEEQLADEFYSSLLHLVINLKSRSCELKSKNRSEKKACLSNLEISNYLIENIPSILTFLEENGGKDILRLTEPRQGGVYLQSILLLFQNFNLEQLNILSYLGICFTVSPSSLYFQDEGKYHVCHGSNVPNNSMVTFHLPTELEITTRTASLSKILSSLFQQPNLVTISRSVRDGYTPKKYFGTIESDLLQSVALTFRDVRLKNVHFDTNLLGGKFGWPNRSQRMSHKLLQHLSLKAVSDL